MSSVYVCVLSRDGKLDRRTREAIDAAVVRAEASCIRCLKAEATGPYGVTSGRNEVVAKFLASKCDYLLFIDDDVTIPPDAITRLVAAGGDIALGCYPGIKTFGDGTSRVYIVLLYLSGGAEDCYTSWPDGVVEVAGGGAGCMLIHRRVLETILYPWFRFQGTYIAPAATVITMGEDIDFCARARSLGFRILADGSVRCGHRKEVDLTHFIPPAP